MMQRIFDGIGHNTTIIAEKIVSKNLQHIDALLFMKLVLLYN